MWCAVLQIIASENLLNCKWLWCLVFIWDCKCCINVFLRSHEKQYHLDLHDFVYWCGRAMMQTALMFTDNTLLGLLPRNEKADDWFYTPKCVSTCSRKHTCSDSKCPKDNVTHLISAAVLALNCWCVWQTASPCAQTHTVGSLSDHVMVYVCTIICLCVCVPVLWIYDCLWPRKHT